MKTFINLITSLKTKQSEDNKKVLEQQQKKTTTIKSADVKNIVNTADENFTIAKASLIDRKPTVVENNKQHEEISSNLQNEWYEFMEALDTNSNIPEKVLDTFSKSNQNKFYNSFIKYIHQQQNIAPNNLSAIMDILARIDESLYYHSENAKIAVIQKKILNIFSKVVQDINIDTQINKNDLPPEELAKINAYTTYMQYKKLAETESIDNQCVKDAPRNFNLDITLNKDGEKLWQSNPQDNKLFQGCYNNHLQGKENAMKDWVVFCRNNVHEFTRLCSSENSEQQENAILLEATQAGSAVISRVMKNYLKNILKLPEEYTINLANFNYKLEIDYQNNKLLMNNQLIINNIEIISDLGVAVATLPPCMITGNLHYNSDSPENSFYDDFIIETI